MQSSTISGKKRKAEDNQDGTNLMGLFLEIKEELTATKAELSDTKAEVQNIKKQLLERSTKSTACLDVVAPGEPNRPPTEAEQELSDDEESVADYDPWSIMFKQLREYRIMKGDCKVPQKYASNPKLGIWVNNQKQRYGNTKLANSGSKLTKERILKLESIGMDWGKNFPAPPSWDERLEEVKQFKMTMRCEPPVNSNNPSPLATWVSAQRKECRRFKHGRGSLLTFEQIERLSDIKFNWKGPRLS